MAKVLAVCVSERKGEKKHQVESIDLRQDGGVVGDAHGDDLKRQISLLGDESVDKLRWALPELKAGDFAENILTEGLILYELPIGTRFQIGDVLLEMTQIGKECHEGCAIRQQTGDCVMPREGVFAKVLVEGLVHPGDEIEIVH
jgi:MOSC domain-containing protein YiiM